MAALANFLLQLCRNSLTWLYNTGIDLLQALFDGLMIFIITVVNLLPSGSMPSGAPTIPSDASADNMIIALNWLFPVTYIMSIFAFLVAGFLAYWAIAPIARWLKILT